MRYSICTMVLLAFIQVSSIPGCLVRKQGGTRRRLPIVDLNDERDDGQSLTLVYSENIIVPPEEDEDPTDDQAPDIDKKEDLEDLDRVIEVHLDDEVYDISSSDFDEKYFFDSSPDSHANQQKVDSSLIDAPGKLKVLKPGKHQEQSSTEVEKFSKSKLKSGMVREPTSKGKTNSKSVFSETYGLEIHTVNQVLIVLMVVFAFLFCLLTIICIIFLVKIRLINRSKTCKSSKTSLIKEVERDEPLDV